MRDIYRDAPGMPSNFYRSSLIIGSRGVGKTTLLRYQKEIHEGIAIHISLATEFASITKQTGLGSWSAEWASELQPQIVGKAISLLALSLAERLLEKGIIIPTSFLAKFLPEELSNAVDASDIVSVAHAKRMVAGTQLDSFSIVSNGEPLSSFVTELGEASQKHAGPLLLLLDRADMVFPPTLIPVLELLDQSNQFIALVAMRPGIHWGQAVLGATLGVAGDHYNVVHLGTKPRSKDWTNFAEEAVEAQLSAQYKTVPEEIRSFIISLSRDSIKNALEMSARYLSVPRDAANKELEVAIQDAKENQLSAAQKTLQKYNVDFQQFIKKLRDSAIEERGKIDGPLILTVEALPAETLFDTSKWGKFVEAGLRCGGFCMLEDQRWVPGLEPTSIEIPPLLVWQKGDEIWGVENSAPISIQKQEKDVLKSFGGGSQKEPSIFVAFRMKFEESKELSKRLSKAIKSNPKLQRFNVVDGHTPGGASWPNVIRHRITSSKFVIGDVTGMRPDVLFELGYARSLRKTTIPVVARETERGNIPRWLRKTQIEHYHDENGIKNILTSIEMHLADPELAKVPKLPGAVPRLAVWMRNLDWNEDALKQFETIADREGIKHELFSDDELDEKAIHRGASASLLIVNLDGTEADGILHYICGAVVAKPKAGYQSASIKRKILILEKPGDGVSKFAADSLIQCHETVQVIMLDDIVKELEKFAEEKRKFELSGTTKGKKK